MVLKLHSQQVEVLQEDHHEKKEVEVMRKTRWRGDVLKKGGRWERPILSLPKCLVGKVQITKVHCICERRELHGKRILSRNQGH